MSNSLGSIYATTKTNQPNGLQKYIMLDSQNVEVSGNFFINGTNSRMPAEIENSLKDYLPLTYGITDPNSSTLFEKFEDLSLNLLTSNHDASFNNVDVSGNLSVNGNVTANNIGVNFAYYEINASQVDMRNNLQIIFGNEVVSNAFITRNAAHNEFTFNQAGMYKIESSAWFAGQSGTSLITFAELKSYHRVSGAATGNLKSISLLDPRYNTGEDFLQMTTSICYILNAAIGDSIYMQGNAIAPISIRTVGGAGSSSNSATNLIITKLR